MPGGFKPEHPAFWLYPTFVHQAEQGLRAARTEQQTAVSTSAPAGGPAPEDPVSIDSLARVEQLWQVQSEAELDLLEPFHIWTTETLRKRFHYRQHGLWILCVRVYRQPESWRLVPSAEQLGCKSWVLLDAARSTKLLQPAMDDLHFAEQLARLHAALGPALPAGNHGAIA